MYKTAFMNNRNKNVEFINHVFLVCGKVICYSFLYVQCSIFSIYYSVLSPQDHPPSFQLYFFNFSLVKSLNTRRPLILALSWSKVSQSSVPFQNICFISFTASGLNPFNSSANFSTAASSSSTVSK